MFRLDFKYSQKNFEREKRKLDWATVSPAEFSYNFTHGRVEMWVGEENLCRYWHDLPVLDFSACLLAIADKLWKVGGAELFEFTEGEGDIRLSRDRDSVSLAINYGGDPVRLINVGIRAFRDEVRRFAQSVVDDAIKRHPEILKNKEFLAWHPLGRILR